MSCIHKRGTACGVDEAQQKATIFEFRVTKVTVNTHHIELQEHSSPTGNYGIGTAYVMQPVSTDTHAVHPWY
jgi:hypothetical protein